MKGYRNRQARPEERGEGVRQSFFFPKHNPPISIEAESLEEAERTLAELDNKKEA
jgi:hypothetical protein